MYGGRTAGMFGYSHFTGGFAGGQSEYTRVPYGDVNLLPLPDDVPDEQGLFLSDVLCTSWHAVVDTGVKKGDVVAIWGAGPIGQMAAEFALLNGASKVIMIDSNWRVDFVKERYPNIETLDFSKLGKGESVTSALKKMCNDRGPDVSIECAAGEYAKGWAHYFEMMLGLETDTSELVNEMIASTRNFGRCGITGVYVGFVSLIHPSWYLIETTNMNLDKPLQHWLAYGAWYPPHWQRTSTCASILGVAPQDDSRQANHSHENGYPPCPPRRPGQGVPCV
jgi:threonine dehydrogenase-like Zn-dependent dehydrogenase